jgi:hypothetical protein
VRGYTFKEPTPEEAAHDFLWRCHAAAPAQSPTRTWRPTPSKSSRRASPPSGRPAPRTPAPR